MKKSFFYPLFAVLLTLTGMASAQQGVVAVDDHFIYTLGQPNPPYNVKTNDIHQGLTPVLGDQDTLCFRLTQDGFLIFIGSDSCCGSHIFRYSYLGCEDSICSADIRVDVLCKPDCYYVNMADPFFGPAGDKKCSQACEYSETVYYVPYNPANTYAWSVAGGTFVPGTNPAEIAVTWGPLGSGLVTVNVTNSGGETTVVQACVDILQSPVADFSAPDSVCLESPVSFTNLTVGASSYSWNFGDGQTSTMFAPTHTYAAPGTYTVCLVATRQNFDGQGNALCCCMDSICRQVVVDPLQGPNIECISTLCANDSTEYWTDAANCSTYFWSVLDENGNPIPFNGQGTDRISVRWGAGPVGTVSLYVEGCDDLYCEDTVSVQVPIISATTAINGPDVVCIGDATTYSVQKWISASYLWTVTNGIIVSGQGTNSVVVIWYSPGPQTISVEYSSEFLSGVPGHDPANCMGAASRDVEVRPRFQVNGPTPAVACVNAVSSFSAFPAANYTWSITPPASFAITGPSSIDVTWNAGPGTYVVTATPDDPTMFCNEVVTAAVEVFEVPNPLAIDGPLEICPGETYTYFGQSSEAGTGFNWIVTGGVPVGGNGYSIAVTWDDPVPPGGYSLSLSQTMLASPFCTSDPIQIAVTPKELTPMISVMGPPTVCINSSSSYSADPPQHADAQYHWSITPAHLGSVISGQGTGNIQVQWNNDAGMADLSVVIELCNASVTVTNSITVAAPVQPTIIQPNTFCAGQTATLDAGPGFCGYNWSAPGGSGQTLLISGGGLYTVTVTDCNGCTATDVFLAEPLPGPPANLPALVILCIQPPSPAAVTLMTPAGPYSYNWSPSLSVTNSLNHNNTNMPGSFLYSVTVTDPVTGCTSVDNSTVVQDVCDPCVPEAYMLDFTATPDAPNNCNVINFDAMNTPNVDLSGWNFNDPNDPVGGGPLDMISHTYTQAGCYTVVLSGSVPNTIGPGRCGVVTSRLVCVPVAADFDYTQVCGNVTFTDQSSVDMGQPAISSWLWNFDDGNMSNLANPTHQYLSPGTYSVTLTVSNGSCTATIVKEVVAGGVAAPLITAAPTPFCVDKPINFSGSAAGAVSWLWNFGDGASNANLNVTHTYVSPGMPYLVKLTVESADGCMNMTTLPINVHPLPPAGTITAMPGLTVCAGTPVVLTALPMGPGYTYEWSTLETTQSITVFAPGEYSVTIYDAEDCSTVPDPVTVVHIPLPDATVSGSNYICDGGCIVLTAPLGNNYSYQWYNPVGPVPGETNSMLLVCSAGLLSPYWVEVTDGNTLCVNTSPPFDVHVVPSPAFFINISPSDCEGQPIDLNIVPVDPDVTYTWSNGATGPSTVVTQAGTYIAIGTHNITGCQGFATAVIHPLPDLCLVPVGCYDICDPDTICGPDDLAFYQWNKDGVPISGENGQCLIVTESGDYSLTGTTSFGCSLASDTLRLKIVNCTCYGLNVSAVKAGTDNCCWTFSYVNPFDYMGRLEIRSNDTDFLPDPGSLDPALQITINTPALIGLESNPLGSPLPSGTLNNFLTVCLENIQNNPQQVIFDWLDVNSVLICSDTLELFTQAARAETISLCPGETVTIGGTPYTAPATVMSIEPGMNGACDTVVTYTLVSLLPAPSVVTITCPPNIVVTAPPGATSMAVTYPDLVATTDCPCPGLDVEITSGLISGDMFPAGVTTTVCYLATDSCGNTATCCFTVQVIETTVCDTKVIGCMKYELLTITQNPAQEKTYRFRVTNICPNKMIYTIFQLPDGLSATAPANNATYTAPSGREYLVRNPNASPFHSIRFMSMGDSIANGESDIFQYTLPAQADVDYIHVLTRVTVKTFFEAYINTFNCPVGMTLGPKLKVKAVLQVAPNPSSGRLNVDLSAWKGQDVRLRVINSSGQLVLDRVLPADAAPQPVLLPAGLADGLYVLEVLTPAGERASVRFVLAR